MLLFSLYQGAKYVTVTQDMSSSDQADVCNEYLFAGAKTGSLGLVTMKKTRKAPGALHPVVVLPPLRVQNVYYGRSRYEPKRCSGSLGDK